MQEVFGEFLRLYPGANILAATKKDFEPARRKKFCSRIATGNYDAVIIGHTQFEKIPLSFERQAAIIERQIDEITLAIEQAEADNGEHYSIKQMEKTKKNLLARLEKLNDVARKDSVVTFEQLGVDRLFVDESHFYKNLFYTQKCATWRASRRRRRRSPRICLGNANTLMSDPICYGDPDF